jgi:hypothetical protein
MTEIIKIVVVSAATRCWFQEKNRKLNYEVDLYIQRESRETAIIRHELFCVSVIFFVRMVFLSFYRSFPKMVV